MSSSTKPSVAIFGATGGTGLSTLRQCLASSLAVNVLVRQPSRLLSLLSFTSAPPNLTMVTGSVRDASAVKSTLRNPDGSLVDIVISLIGFAPNPSAKGLSFDLFQGADRSICRDGTQLIVECIAELKAEAGAATSSTSAALPTGAGPVLVVLSTTGISHVGRDIPLLVVPLYHMLLSPPHKDKRAMEDYLRSLSSTTSPSSSASAQKWVIIRPSLLRGDGKGEPSKKKVRVGIEQNGKFESKAIGYSITREDVANWIYRNIIVTEGDGATGSGSGGAKGKGGDEWVGKCVTLTY
jgi:NAD(P)H-binding